MNMEYPIGIKNDPHIKIIARKYAFPKTDNSKTQIERGEIIGRSYFYIPVGLSQQTSSNWNVEDIGVMGNIADDDYMKGLVTAGIKIVDKFSAGSVSSAKKALGALQGELLAPNDVLVLGSVNRYSMVLALQLAPQNAEEGKQVKNIIQKYREWSQPTLDTDGAKITMHYPPVFDIMIRPKAGSFGSATSDDLNPNNNLFYYRDMVIENFDIQYQGGTNESLFYRDGSPVLASLRVGFKSLKPGFNIDSSLNDKKK